MHDFTPIIKQLESRKNDQISRLFFPQTQPHGATTLFINANSDLGVCRNGGRKGSAYAPFAILQIFKKMAIPQNQNNHNFEASNVLNFEDDLLQSFEQLQLLETENIKNKIKNKNFHNLIHIGGGHDHIFPFISALSNDFKKMTILNLDAHLDTRIDPQFHSGTPFRQAFEIKKLKLKIHQWGIKEASNVSSNYQNLPMKIISHEKLKLSQSQLEDLLEENIFSLLEDDELFILSLDCDVIASYYMEAVSAVNYNGIDYQTIKDIFVICKKFVTKKQKPFVAGIYEYNPLFDNLSQKGARLISDLIYHSVF